MILIASRWGRLAKAIVVLGCAAGLLVTVDSWTAFGRKSRGDRLLVLEASPQYVGSRFENPLPTVEPDSLPLLWRWLFEKEVHQFPSEEIPIVHRRKAEFATISENLRVTWFGHSTLLVEMDGHRLLIDPMWGPRASPSRVFGVNRFHEPPLPLGDLPSVDAVILSHDHYDHLDEPTIKALEQRTKRFITPLGVGSHLEYWGVPKEKITELDWWQSTVVGEIQLVCTPARHFSGRFLNDHNATLWAGWALLGRESRIFFSGDSALHPTFKEIGERLGPFDLTFMEVGAYNQDWPDSHMGPEQAVEAHRQVGGRLLLPVHWGTFDLAFHSWVEPMERLLVAAERAHVSVVTLKPGESLDPAQPPPIERWWPNLPWQNAEEMPIVSSHLNPNLN